MRRVLPLVLLVACSKPAKKEETPSKPAPAVTLAAVTPQVPPANEPTHEARRVLSGKKVLHAGDSMVGGTFGLTRELEAKLAAEGAKLVRHTTVSETLQSFDKGPTLRDLLRTHEPDVVIITLGTNDATVPFPQAYAHHVTNIVKRIGDRECWWIGPPSQKGRPPTELAAVLRGNMGSCRFFDSSNLELERASDGIHPNDRGAARWASAFWTVFRAETVRPD